MVVLEFEVKSITLHLGSADMYLIIYRKNFIMKISNII